MPFDITYAESQNILSSNGFVSAMINCLRVRPGGGNSLPLSVVPGSTSAAVQLAVLRATLWGLLLKHVLMQTIWFAESFYFSFSA